MRKSIVLLSVLFLVSISAAAQADAPPVEVFGGYQYARLDGDVNMNGWAGQAAFNFNNNFGLVADFGGHYKSEGGASLNQHTFLFGPRLSARGEAGTGFVHALFGGARLGEEVLGVSASETAFAMALGGGFDWNLNEAFAIRVAQVDYLMTRYASDTQNHVRLSTGVVFRFGSR